ncbi:MAG: M20/M25/M40 family metallo-hydrolase [Acidimicrobiales bacterium]|nr:M20/M25/M40 family metallo-hydrolase [Hyphomonadaceae bacterium]RZV41418.1 MAG: M20/M25/M40 family metallo-hydrolase [Acidimicrobiales bacterium]
MKKIKLFVLALVVLFLILTIIVLVRTYSLSKSTVTTSDASVDFIDIDKTAASINLAKAVRFKTVTEQVRDDTDWQEFEKFQAWMRETYPAFYDAVKTETIADHALYHTWEGSDPSLDPIVFMAHQDVVPASEDPNSGWEFPPFGGDIIDGFVYGRGTIDCKGTLIGLMEAANRLAASGYQPKRKLIFSFGHDEEISGSGAKTAAELMKSRGIKPYAVIDEGGAIITGLNGIEKPIAMIGVAEKGYLTLVLTAKARGGHSSTPPTYTAIGALSKAIAIIEANPFDSGMDKVTKKMLQAMATEQDFKTRMAMANLWLFRPMVEKKMKSQDQSRAMLGTTIAPTIIDAGFKENALPREAKAYVNFRLHSRDSVASVMDRVRRLIDDPNIEIVKADGIGSEPSPVSQIGTGPYTWIEDVITTTFPGLLVSPNVVLGGTDSRYMALVTNDIYRFAPYKFDTSDMARIHGLNERMDIDVFVKGIQTYYLMLEKAGEG